MGKRVSYSTYLWCRFLSLSDCMYRKPVWWLKNCGKVEANSADVQGFCFMENRGSAYITMSLCLLQILKNLKNTYWPFQQGHTESLFLRAANAANCINRLRLTVNHEHFFCCHMTHIYLISPELWSFCLCLFQWLWTCFCKGFPTQARSWCLDQCAFWGHEACIIWYVIEII